MKKLIIILFLCLATTAARATAYRIIGFYPMGVSRDYVIIYSYYDANDQLVLSHCRTNKISENGFTHATYLDIDTCTIKQPPVDIE